MRSNEKNVRPTARDSQEPNKPNKPDELDQPGGEADEAVDDAPPPAQEDTRDAQPPEDREEHLPCIVGIGASAGGLDAFKHLFKALPDDTGLAFVLVQHLEPTRQSLVPELLQHYTAMPVAEVEDGVPPQPNHVYLAPPAKQVTLTRGKLCLNDAAIGGNGRAPIDFFLRSLASELQHKALGVVLSGSGVDGTLGLKAVKAEGGLTLAQDTETAQYSDMPCSAISAGVVDHVLPVEKMPPVLTHYAQHMETQLAVPDDHIVTHEEADLHSVLQQLYDHTRYEFRSYKKSMLLRRLARRMSLHHLGSLSAYVKYLKEQPTEIDALAKDLLISVTDFFRDRQAWHVLDEQVIGPLVHKKAPEEPIRIWIPGCATGEEAYSVAMLVIEHLRKTQKTCPLMILATDIDAAALKRRGRAFIPPAFVRTSRRRSWSATSWRSKAEADTRPTSCCASRSCLPSRTWWAIRLFPSSI